MKSQQQQDRAMADAERRRLEPDPEPSQCSVTICLGPCCKLRGDCPEPDKLSDYEWERRDDR
jgi:hypothetical protein